MCRKTVLYCTLHYIRSTYLVHGYNIIHVSYFFPCIICYYFNIRTNMLYCFQAHKLLNNTHVFDSLSLIIDIRRRVIIGKTIFPIKTFSHKKKLYTSTYNT